MTSLLRYDCTRYFGGRKRKSRNHSASAQTNNTNEEGSSSRRSQHQRQQKRARVCSNMAIAGGRSTPKWQIPTILSKEADSVGGIQVKKEKVIYAVPEEPLSDTTEFAQCMSGDVIQENVIRETEIQPDACVHLDGSEEYDTVDGNVIDLHTITNWTHLLTEAKKRDESLLRITSPILAQLKSNILRNTPRQPLLIYGVCGSGKSEMVAQLKAHPQLVVEDLTDYITEYIQAQIYNGFNRDKDNTSYHQSNLTLQIFQLLVQPPPQNKKKVIVIDDADQCPEFILNYIFNPRQGVIKYMAANKCKNHLLLTTSVLYEHPMRYFHAKCCLFKLEPMSNIKLLHIMANINKLCNPQLERTQLVAFVYRYSHDLRFCLINYRLEVFAEELKAPTTNDGAELPVCDADTISWDEQQNELNMRHLRPELSIMNSFRQTFRNSVPEIFIMLQREPMLIDILHTNWVEIFRYDAILRCDTKADLKRPMWVLAEKEIPMKMLCEMDMLANFSFWSGTSSAIGVCQCLATWMWAVLFKLPQCIVANVNTAVVPSRLAFPSTRSLKMNHTHDWNKMCSTKLSTLTRNGHSQMLSVLMSNEQAVMRQQCKKKKMETPPTEADVYSALLSHEVHTPWQPIPDNLLTSRVTTGNLGSATLGLDTIKQM